jgi:CRP-like cAMP-binding protein
MTLPFTQIHQELAALLPAALHESCVRASYARGDRLFSAGERPKYMFFISSGEVLLERMGMQGASIVLQRTRSGIISEASLRSERYHCHANVVLPSEITGVPILKVNSALISDSAFSNRWIAMLNREVKRLRLQCERLSLHRVDERLMHFLETEGTNGQHPLGSGLKSLASELGVTHEALYRCVAQMEKRGILHRGAENLRIVSSDASRQTTTTMELAASEPLVQRRSA